MKTIRKVFTNPNDNSFTEKQCYYCKKIYWEKTYFAFRYKTSYCNRKCYAKHQKVLQSKENCKFWKGGKIYRRGYVFIKIGKGEPGTDSQGYIREHRLIIQKHIGRILSKNENVHHVNGIKTDNRLENLTLLIRSKHSSISIKGRKMSEETKHKLSVANKKGSYGFKKGHIPVNKGIPHSEETRRRFRDAWKIRKARKI